MKTLSEKALRSQLETARAALNEIDKARRVKENASLVGKCFKFENSFGCDRPPWWLYVKIIAGGDYWPTALSFENRSDGTFEVKKREAFSGVEHYTEITSLEFDEAKAEFTEKLLLSLKAMTTSNAVFLTQIQI